MAPVAPSSDKAADLLQNLSLDPNPKTTGVAEPAKKNGPAYSNGTAKGMNKPLSPNPCYVPNGYPSTYYYGGYDGQGDWNVYSSYMNLDGGMAQGLYGDNCSYMYNQGYGYTPYGAYAPNSSSPIIQHDGQQLYGLQQYQYPSSYYKSPASADVSFAPNKISVPQGETPTAVNADHVPYSNVMNKGNTVSIANGDCANKNGLNAILTSSQHSTLNTNNSYQGAGMPAYAPVSGYQGPRMGGTQSAIPSDVSLVSDRQPKHGAKAGLSSQSVPVKSYNSQRNQRYPQPLQPFTNLNGSGHPSGMDLVSGFMNSMYPSNAMYSHYGNTFRTGSRFGSAAYGSRTGSLYNKSKATGNGCVHDFKRNGFSELNKGPRAGKNSDSKSIQSLGPVTLLLKGQNLPVKSDSQEVPLVPSKEQYNGEDFSDNYSDAKFFVIKSYSEDDIHKSIKYSVWSSTSNGNKKLDAAYQEAKEKPGGCPIFLLFSVNTSGQFVGLAEMVGPVDFGKTVEYWQQDRWTGCFAVKWHVVKDIPNNALRHITLENNENKPVTNSRDTQEVKFEKGIEVVKVFKEHSSKTSILDDFGFYELREKATQERKSKEQQVPKQVNKASDMTVSLPKSLDAPLVNESATADAAEGKVNAEELLERKGSTTVVEESPKSC